MSLREEKTGVLLSRVGMYRLNCRRQQNTEDFYSRLYSGKTSSVDFIRVILIGQIPSHWRSTIDVNTDNSLSPILIMRSCSIYCKNSCEK
jgi:hypothetical protein